MTLTRIAEAAANSVPQTLTLTNLKLIPQPPNLESLRPTLPDQANNPRGLLAAQSRKLEGALPEVALTRIAEAAANSISPTLTLVPQPHPNLEYILSTLPDQAAKPRGLLSSGALPEAAVSRIAEAAAAAANRITPTPAFIPQAPDLEQLLPTLLESQAKPRGLLAATSGRRCLRSLGTASDRVPDTLCLPTLPEQALGNDE